MLWKKKERKEPQGPLVGPPLPPPSPRDHRLEDFINSLPPRGTRREEEIASVAAERFSHHVKALRDIVKSREADIDDLQRKYEHEADQVHVQRKFFENEQRKTNQAHLQDIKVQAEVFDGIIAAANQQHALKLQNLTNAFEDQKQTSKRELEGQQAQHDRKVQAMNRQLENANFQHDRKVSELKETHRRQREVSKQNVASAKAQHDNEMRVQQKRASDQIQKLKNDHQSYTTKLELDHQSYVTKLKQDHHTQATQLIAEHEAETKHLRVQVTELNDALLHDDEVYSASMFSTSKLPQRTDASLKDSFVEIMELVDTISRWTWSATPTDWPEDLLQRLSGQPETRRLKRAILQDIVWCVLCHRVFASPFRMLGDPGLKLEHEWAQNSGNYYSKRTGTYSWPPPSAQAERWRYMTLDKCREALKQDVSQWDPRAQLKKGYSDSVAELAAKLEASLQNIAALNDQSSGVIAKLSKKAAKIWLDFSMHRPRIVIEMLGQGSMSISERTEQIKRGEVILTLVPTLKRYGNSEGTDLDKITSLKDGESLALSRSR